MHMRTKGSLSRALAVFALTSVLALVGCGGSSSQETGETDGGQAALEEASGLSKEDVVGYYLLDGASDAIFTDYQLKEDGTFVMEICAAGSSVERTGTYEIRDGKVYVNVPEGESGEITVKGTTMNISAKAVEDAELVIEGDTLTTSDIGQNGVTAQRITSEKYQELVEATAAFASQTIAVGEAVNTDSYSFTVDSFDYHDEVYPSDTSGYYTYWEHVDGHSYLVADVTYTNQGTDYQVPGYSTQAILKVGENNYEASIETDGGNRTSASYSIDPKDTARIIIVASVPDAAIEEGGEVKLIWSFPRDGSLLNSYYRSANESVEYVLTK